MVCDGLSVGVLRKNLFFVSFDTCWSLAGAAADTLIFSLSRVDRTGSDGGDAEVASQKKSLTPLDGKREDR